jgi:hypothetical protein
VALTDEQRTLLQLLLEGGQGYEDIGSLLGIGTDEVRSRARSALQEIGGADPDAQVGLTDYLLGQADPIGRADAVRHLQADPEANALAQRLVQNLRLLAPNAQLPEIPEPRGGRRPAAPSAPPAPAAPAPEAGAPAPPPPPSTPKGPGVAARVAGFFSGLGRLQGRRRTQAIAGAAAGLAIVIVLIVVATSGGSSGGGGSDCKPVDTSQAQQAGVPLIKLTAMGAAANADCPPSGQITLGRAQQNQSSNKSQTPVFILQANAVHLQPTQSGERYLLWLYKSDTQAVPLGQETVDSSGNLTGGVPLLAQQVLLLPAFDTVRFSKVTSAQAQQLQQALQSQGKKSTGAIQFTGNPVLQGNISELGLNQLLQQAQSQAGAGGSGASGAGTSGGAGNKKG